MSARRWIRGARKTIKTLAQLPERYPLAPEAESFGEPIREAFYGSGNRGTYRILYMVWGPQSASFMCAMDRWTS
jgi:hypothetical protein